MSDQRLGTLMVAFYATDDHKTSFIGEVVSIADQPSLTFKAEGTGCQAHWLASLCRPATKDEQIEYWKNRALAAAHALPTPQEDPNG